MSLKDTLKFIQDVANKYLIDKPFVVGGLPRDIFMDIPNVKTTDIDLTTNSPEVLRLGILLADELNVTFELSDDGHITVFSEEFDLDFSSHFISDEVISFLDGKNAGLEEAFSRDFTINALHQDLISGEITDPTGKGFDDIKKKLINTPVPAKITLTDDPRRAYRAINLASRYGFDISPEIKEFTISNPELFSAENVKDKYISVKIGKALKENEELTLKLLREMNLFKNVPLSGYFKEVLIERKILVDYLGSAAKDHRTAYSANTWESYTSQGPAYKALSDWWKTNATNMPGSKNQSYMSWANWYMNKYRGDWGGKHRGPEDTLVEMKSELNTPAPVTPERSFTTEFENRKQDLYGLLGISDKAEQPARVERLTGDVDTKPGVDIENVTPAVKSFIKEVGIKAKEFGAQTPLITSGWRSPETQAYLMARNWKANGGINGGRQYLEQIYGRDYGSQMASVFEQYGPEEAGQSYGIKVIKSRPVGSYHIISPGKALDFRATPGIKEVLNAIQSDGKFSMKVVDETGTAGPHYHVTIHSENVRMARIRSRKERLNKLGSY